MGENTDQIERDIQFERAELGRNLEDLELKAKELADWKVHYRNHPTLFLGAAAGVGVLLGALIGPVSVRSANRTHSPNARPFLQGSPKVAQLRTTWEHVSDALLALATAKAINVVSDYLPGFKDQYELQTARPGRERDYAIR
jgi:hypothetical protein